MLQTLPFSRLADRVIASGTSPVALVVARKGRSGRWVPSATSRPDQGDRALDRIKGSEHLIGDDERSTFRPPGRVFRVDARTLFCRALQLAPCQRNVLARSENVADRQAQHVSTFKSRV